MTFKDFTCLSFIVICFYLLIIPVTYMQPSIPIACPDNTVMLCSTCPCIIEQNDTIWRVVKPSPLTGQRLQEHFAEVWAVQNILFWVWTFVAVFIWIVLGKAFYNITYPLPRLAVVKERAVSV